MNGSTAPEKFLKTGLNELDGHTPAEWSQAAAFVTGTVLVEREQSLEGIESIPLTERQLLAVQTLAMPAIMDTLTDVLGSDGAEKLAGKTFVSYLNDQNFDRYYGGGNNAAGVYYSDRNFITVRESNAKTDSPEGLAYFIKVFVHEYFHYLSHQYGSLQGEQLGIERVGVQTLGEDIREANEGLLTWDYFLSHNEAITEKLSIETIQKIAHDTTFKDERGDVRGFYETYDGYRSLLEEVMSDAIRYRATDLTGTDLWRSVCRGYLTGNLKPLIELIHGTYPGLRVKEFGLMTNIGDLPGPNDFILVAPDDRPPGGAAHRVSDEYLARLRNRLNGKTSRDYVHDVESPPPPPPSSAAVKLHTQDIATHRAEKMYRLGITKVSNGMFVNEQNEVVEYDEHGNVIRYNQSWLKDLLPILTEVSVQFRAGTIYQQQAEAIIDQVLFKQRRISELSSGFGDFYVIKHILLDPDTSTNDFNTHLSKANEKLRSL
jgi:hypothetical protein